MAIINKDSDTWSSKVGVHLTGLYFYALNNNLEELENSSVIGFAPTIQSVVFCPFFNVDNVDLYKIGFDTDYFGKPSTQQVNVYRIVNKQYYYTDKLFSKNLFFNKPSISLRNWQNESKLQMSPYTYYQIADYYNSPLEIEPQYLPNNGQLDVKVMYTVSNKGSYNLFVDGYKGDYLGNVHGIINQNSLDIPVSSSAYSQFLANSKNSFTTNLTNAIDTNNLNKAQNKTNFQLDLLNSVSNFGNLLGVFTGGINSGAKYQMASQQLELSKQQTIASAMAQVRDLETAPRSMVSTGNDALFSMSNSTFNVNLVKFGLSGDGYERLENYFAMYGYKQNKFMAVNYRNRYYYNYIKTLDCNIKGNIPKEYLEKIKTIFNNGLTFWHVDRENVKILDYSYDNYEI